MYIVVNFKQNLNLASYEDYTNKLLAYTEINNLNHDLILCPPFPYLQFFKSKFINVKRIFIGAQDISNYISGSHTGQVSALHIKDMVDYCIVNHSETINENEIIGSGLKLKILNLLEAGIKPIICFKRYEIEIENLSLNGNEILAFEDPSHIGKMETSSESEIQEFCASFGKNFVFLYGGSLSDTSFLKLKNVVNISGFLTSSYVLDVNNLIKILKIS